MTRRPRHVVSLRSATGTSVLGAPAGVLADRLDNRRLLVATSSASGVLALTFGVVVTTGHATIWWIYALTFLLGFVLAVERPTMQAILFQLVGRDLLPNAVAANGTINSVSRLVGPAIAGVLIATVGVNVGFFINAGSVGAAMSVSAIGSIIGGIYIAGIKPHPRRTLAIALTGFGAACLALAVMPSYWTFVAMSVVLGFASASFQSVNTVVVQQSTEPSMQGRVMALHQTALFGSTPIGALLMGWVIHVSSPRLPFMLGGLSALLCATAVIGRRTHRVVTAMV